MQTMLPSNLRLSSVALPSHGTSPRPTFIQVGPTTTSESTRSMSPPKNELLLEKSARLASICEKFFEFIGLIFINPLLILNNSRIQSLILLGTYSLIP